MKQKLFSYLFKIKIVVSARWHFQKNPLKKFFNSVDTVSMTLKPGDFDKQFIDKKSALFFFYLFPSILPFFARKFPENELITDF